MEQTAVHDNLFRACEIADLDYSLPEELIAQVPASRREDARLMMLDRAAGTMTDGGIVDLPDRLRPHDLLVLNDAKVLPARFAARRSSGGRVDALFIEEIAAGRWRILLRGSARLRPGETIFSTARDETILGLTLAEALGEGQWLVEVNAPGSASAILETMGSTPLPPYIRRSRDDHSVDPVDRARYQTVYARAPGSIAAPTAGLHLTEELLARVRSQGAAIACVTLHVGLGTFSPIRVDRLADHVMHAERYSFGPNVAEQINRCREHGGRVVAVGTTSVRVLESVAAISLPGRPLQACDGSTDIFIRPPYSFRLVDALLTNFHLPRSTLLALVMAFAGVERTRAAYRRAVERRYRFYSFGDAMLIE